MVDHGNRVQPYLYEQDESPSLPARDWISDHNYVGPDSRPKKHKKSTKRKKKVKKVQIGEKYDKSEKELSPLQLSGGSYGYKYFVPLNKMLHGDSSRRDDVDHTVVKKKKKTKKRKKVIKDTPSTTEKPTISDKEDDLSTTVDPIEMSQSTITGYKTYKNPFFGMFDDPYISHPPRGQNYHYNHLHPSDMTNYFNHVNHVFNFGANGVDHFFNPFAK